ncbi:MAG TPA: hypothetical protein VLV16_06720 [Gemmatimonadales bacterium]|nr:hypothetical protein [Gemmatimonadales bacterium]
MRRGALMVESGRSTRRGRTVAGRVAALFFAVSALAAPAVSAQGTPAGTHVTSWAYVSFVLGGSPYLFSSDTVDLVVAQVGGADLQPPRSSVGAAGTAVVFAHTLSNVGNGTDSFTVAAVSAHGWPVVLHRDLNADGILDPTDLLLAGPVTLTYGGLTHLLAQVSVPSVIPLGVTDTITITATSRFDPAAKSSVVDPLSVPAGTLAITVTKQVDRAAAAAGDVITYTLDYAASGGGVTTSALVADTVPAGTSYVPGTMRLNGTPLTDASGDDAGTLLPAGSGVISIDLGAPVSGASGTVTFQVRVNNGAPGPVTNKSYAIWSSGVGTDTAFSGTVQTNILVPQLALSKQLVGPGQAQVGQQVRYSLHYGNGAGAAPVAAAVLSDSLPAGLDYVSATPAATVAGTVLTWPIGALAPGDSGVVDLVLQVNPTVRDTVWVRNVGTLAAAGGAATAQSAAAQVALIGPSTAAIALDLTATVLDAAVGDVIPYTLTVRNPGVLPLDSIRVTGTLPAGGHYVKNSALGADSVQVAGSSLLVFTGAPLAPGAVRTLHFAMSLSSAPGTVAETRAVAAGRAGSLAPVSPEAIAWVQVRRAWPMETRAAIGRVSVAGDSGLAGIDIWTEDGQVATTDASGKYSFHNLRPGRHVFRLDVRTLPAGYRVAGDELQAVEASGWTTPKVDFRVVRDGAPEAAAMPEAAQAPVDARALVGVRFSATRSHGLVRYEVNVRKAARLPLDAMIEFSPVADSALVFVGDSQYTRYSWLGNTAIPLPADVPRTDYRIVAWSSARSDSAKATLRVGRSRQAFRAPVGHGAPAASLAWTPVALRRVAVSDSAPAGQMIDVLRGPVPAGWPNLAAALPEDWQPVAVRVTVPGARSAPRHSAGLAALLATGPSVRIFAPGDGSVLASDRVYVGVKGDADAPVVLYDGAKRLDSVHVRVDGVYDFVAVPLARGPHLLRVRMTNSWGAESWDSIALHITGLPARFSAADGPITMVADGHTLATVRVRVLDAWSVPVVQPAYVTLRATGAEALGADADPSSVGLQQLTDSAGWLVVTLQPGHTVTRGELEVRSGDARATLPLEILPELRPLTVTGSGMVGAGASPDAYGALTARGQLDRRTSVTVGLDSRRLNDGQDVFARSADPLNESQYPILGDASYVETRTASRDWLSARLERGYDWAAYGDLSGTSFGAGLALSQYRRALTGLAAQVRTGPVTWSGFGSLTSQALQQLQVRGTGVSGPYTLGTGILPGTEQLRMETRDVMNPERVVTTQALARFVDYEIDYTSGVVLFKQPVPATDTDGNPLFIMATFEATSSSDQQLVAGGRAALDIRQLAQGVRLDSLRVGFTAVNAAQTSNDYRLLGGDLRAYRLGALDFAAEVAYAEHGDSTGFGALGRAGFTTLHGALTLGASVMRVDREFTNPANVALQPGLTDVTVKGVMKVANAEIRAEHSSQDFEVQGMSRSHSRFGIMQPLRPNLFLDAGVANDQVSGGQGGGLGFSNATTAALKTSWAVTPTAKLWAEAQRHLSLDGQELAPDFWGVGGSYQVLRGVALEATQRFVSRPDSATQYATSSVGVRATVGHGTEAWGNYQLTGGISGAANAAVVGLRNRLEFRPGVAMNVMFERRMGISSAAFTDPVRALPFVQPEDDYWAASAGIELTPADRPYRLSARAEFKDGTLQSSNLMTVAGDIAFDSSLALLTRQQFAQNELPGAPRARQVSSLWGLAFRPAKSDRLNMLAKIQWTGAENPIGGGVLVTQGSESRVIGATELMWTPSRAVEVGGRYAMRRAQTDQRYADSTSQTLVAWADYLGGRMSVALAPWLRVQYDGRVLFDRSSGTSSWDGAPALAFRPVPGLELVTGYRFGNLSDPDFSVRGGHGAFVTLSATITEKLFPTAAEFWRARF